MTSYLLEQKSPRVWCVGLFSALGILAVSGLSGCATLSTVDRTGHGERQPASVADASATPKATASVAARRSILPVPKAKNYALDGGVLLALEAIDANPETVCRLRFVGEDSQGGFRNRMMTIKLGDVGGFVALEPGHYDLVRMGCGISYVWDLSGVYANGFDVVDGNVSYLGKLVLHFEDGELSEVSKASRGDSATALAKASVFVPDVQPIVSAFTGEVVTREMRAQTLSASGGFRVNASGLASESLTPLLSRLEACDAQGAKLDPLRLGRLEYTASYKSGAFNDFKDRRDLNTFSNEFKSCVADSLATFRPPRGAAIDIQVVY